MIFFTLVGMNDLGEQGFNFDLFGKIGRNVGSMRSWLNPKMEMVSMALLRLHNLQLRSRTLA